MKFFLIVQDSVNDDDSVIDGPFANLGDAKKSAEEYDFKNGRIFTILVQKSTKFIQVSQAILGPNVYVWK